MSRQGWEDQSIHTASSSRYDPTHTSLRGGGGGGGVSRPTTPAASQYSDYMPMPPQRNTAVATSSKKKAPSNKSSSVTAQNLPHHKAGRVKVGIRIRPAFKDEISNMRGPFTPIIAALNELDNATGLGKVVLTAGANKQREFKFDYAFGPQTTQDQVYDKVGRPVVTDVLSGFNGTIFAYGQTGTGKTYTMGILEAVNDDHAGIIPRSMSHIFQHILHQKHVESSVSMSFIQIYRENIQDLLSASIVNGQGGAVVEENLVIREDPQKGFYVEGLQEYVVRSYEEAEALLNLGLENRAIASTLMNSTSSRSHTVITVIIEQKGHIPSASDDTSDGRAKVPSSYHRVLRSKLLMVDLAGSERVRKTTSKGTRLDEAKSINTSLSALGNVIAALAESNMSHVPYRDSKLTKILHDSLGGTASTSLVATVGPISSHYNETLSTLQFGSRCMAVKSTPVQHEEVDFADMCAQLQHQLSTAEGHMSAKLNEQSEKYENTIRQLREQIQSNGARGGGVQASPRAGASGQVSPSLSAVLGFLENHSSWDDSDGLSWFKAARWVDEDGLPTEGTEASVMLAYCFDALKKLYKTTSALIEDSKLREKEQEENLVKLLGEVAVKENKAELEKMAMANCDPTRHLDSFSFVGSHLAQISKGGAFARIKEMYGLEGEAVHEREEAERAREQGSGGEAKVLKNIADYTSAEELAKSIDFMTNKLGSNVDILYGNIDKKDLVLGNLKVDLMTQMAEKRSREEEVVNWSYILKYLLATTSKLRTQLAEEQQRYASASAQMSTLPGKRFSTPSARSKNTEMLRVTQHNDEDGEDEESFTVPPRAPVQAGQVTTASSHSLKSRPSSSSSRPSSASAPAARMDAEVDLEQALREAEFEETNVNSNNSRSPEQNYHLRNIAAANNSITSGKVVREERKRLSQAGKLGPRLQNSRSAVLHNAAVSSEVDQIGPPSSNRPGDDTYYDDDGGSLNDSDAAGSFRSAATVNSIPPYPSSSASYKRKSSQQNQKQQSGRGVDNHHRYQQQQQQQQVQQPSARVPSSTNFAQNVVQGLGVVGQEAEAAMTVIERVSQMTSSDIARLDAETRQQVMQIRLELGIIEVDDQRPRLYEYEHGGGRGSGSGRGGGNDFYRGSQAAAGMYTPASNITMSDDDDDTFSQLDDDAPWR